MEGVSLPTDFHNNFLIALRLVHFLAGITWIGLLYFFNLVSGPVAKELDFPTRAKVFPKLAAFEAHPSSAKVPGIVTAALGM